MLMHRTKLPGMEPITPPTVVSLLRVPTTTPTATDPLLLIEALFLFFSVPPATPGLRSRRVVFVPLAWVLPTEVSGWQMEQPKLYRPVAVPLLELFAVMLE